MIELETGLVDKEEAFDQVRAYLSRFDFSLGGNWDYDHGYFDRFLDEGHKVWLRIPIVVTHGALDGDTEATSAIIRIGTPFVLKHIYNEGLDKEAQMRTFGGLIDQFQEPLDEDAPVEGEWVNKARQLMSQVEAGWDGRLD